MQGGSYHFVTHSKEWQAGRAIISMVRKIKKKGSSQEGDSLALSPKSSKSQETIVPVRDLLLDTFSEAIAAINSQGCIMECNAAWRRLSQQQEWMQSAVGNGETSGPFFHIGALKAATGEALLAGLRSVAEGENAEFQHEFGVVDKGKPRWFCFSLKPLPGGPRGILAASLRDVTDRCKAEHDLRESHILFHHVLEGTGDAIFMYDTEGRFLLHNSVGAELLPAGQGQVAGKKIEEVFPLELAQFVCGQNALVLSTGRTISYELVMETSQGSRTMLVQKGVYRNHRNEAVGVIGIARDITERKRAEEKLQQSERRFRALIEKSSDCVFLIAEDTTILYASPSSKEISGFLPEELIGTNGLIWFHPDDLQEARRQLEALLQTPGSSSHGEFRHLCKDGEWRWMECVNTNLLHDPSVSAIVVNARDITASKEDERKLRRFKAIVESSIDAIMSIDLDAKVTSWNPAAQRIFGYSEEVILGRDFRILVPEDRLQETSEFLDRVLRGKGTRDYETVRLGNGGKRIEVSITLSPVLDSERRIVGATAIVRDITERRKLEKQVLEISDFEKRRIGQDLHDDLCQHLVGISMIGNLLHSELFQLGIKQAEDARKITEMIRNAVDHARILARGLTPLNMAHGGLMAGLETLIANTEQMFRIPWSLECPEAVHIEDPEVAIHLFRIAQEALHNAVKHSNGSKVVVRMEQAEDTLRITVRDDGIGLMDTAKQSTGGGLGMHTMYYRARIIGAKLEIVKNAEGGATVVCRLPFSRFKTAV